MSFLSLFSIFFLFRMQSYEKIPIFAHNFYLKRTEKLKVKSEKSINRRCKVGDCKIKITIHH